MKLVKLCIINILTMRVMLYQQSGLETGYRFYPVKPAMPLNFLIIYRNNVILNLLVFPVIGYRLP